PSVVAAQERYGSRRANHGFTLAAEAGNRLGAAESAFIAERDSFYQATVSQDGWPYVQHRGGPPGFLRVLDPGTLAYADFRGNLQYVSMGNLGHDGRVALFLIDFRQKLRLKVLGHARFVDLGQASTELVQQIDLGNYFAEVERAVLIEVAAFEWNCPRHITPRYTGDEVRALVEPLQARIAELERQLAARDRDGEVPGD
ncbi:MAG TPA: pyridoxamine 5'-phosphate oxidase family protein, partial [Plasticicumulans sp.]|nr:pyridoxamine 5'-phosphate oxidase family protein [Plasticicumulans sp.]